MKKLWIYVLSFFLFGISYAKMNPYALFVPCLYDDSFNAINATYWTETDAYSVMAIASGELHYSSSSTVFVISLLRSNWYFSANTDFDIRVDFNDFSSTPGDSSTFFNGINMEITNSDDSIYSHIGRELTNASANIYTYKGSATAQVGISTTDTSGKFRITNVSGTITIYYWDAGESRWEWNDNASGQAMSENFTDANIYIYLTFVKRAAVGGDALTADLDNFKVVKGCENIVLP